VEDSLAVHVVNGFYQLPHVVFHTRFWQIHSSSFNCIVQVHVHQFKDEGQAACGLVVQHFVQFYYLRMRREAAQSLNLAQVVNLFRRSTVSRKFNEF